MDSNTLPLPVFSKCGRLQRYRKKITPKNEAAFIRNATPELVAAITNPPSAGPTARATLNPTELRATAGAWFSRQTTSGVIACQAGPFITAPRPSTKENSNKIHGGMQPSNDKIPSSPAATTIQACVI